MLPFCWIRAFRRRGVNNGILSQVEESGNVVKGCKNGEVVPGVWNIPENTLRLPK